jgi:hypothetical protein
MTLHKAGRLKMRVIIPYFVETAFKRDFKESEKDCISDGPALSGVDCPVECLLIYQNHQLVLQKKEA